MVDGDLEDDTEPGNEPLALPLPKDELLLEGDTLALIEAVTGLLALVVDKTFCEFGDTLVGVLAWILATVGVIAPCVVGF